MMPRWTNLNDKDRAAFLAIASFLTGRLEERATIDWALRLKANETLKRLAVSNQIDNPEGRRISEPWRSAWRLIEESWSNQTIEDHASTGVYQAQHRLNAGDRSGALVASIVKLVAPRLEIEPLSDMHLYYQKPSKRPKKVGDLFSVSLRGGKIVDPVTLGLGNLTDRSFLLSLAVALDAAVTNGLDIARRIGWDCERRLWQLGWLYRVFYVPVSERAEGEHEPDEFHHGIEPSVKLLHSVVSRLVTVHIPDAVEFVRKWKLIKSPVYLRLWAVLSQDSRVTAANEVGEFLLSLDDRHFWDLRDFPEISELRARRFNELDPREQTLLNARIRKRPPRNQWPRKADADRVDKERLRWTVRELRRIEIAGGPLSTSDKAWLDARIHEFPDLVHMVRIDEGFLESPKARWVPRNPDNRYDLLTGIERLKALEAALKSERHGWDDDPAQRAVDWVRQRGNPGQILVDFESIPDGGAAFARVWEWFAWTHSPETAQDEDEAQQALPAECVRVLSLLDKLSNATVRQAIDGVSHWLSTWEKQVVVLPEGLSVWLKLWPIAVEATNAKRPEENEASLNTVAQSSDNQDPMDLDTLNTPAGKLVGVFLASCPNLQENNHPFDADGTPRRMRDAIIAVTGRSGLIARHRMIEDLPYFLDAAPDWTRVHLITPLIADDSGAIALWRAIARQTHFCNVLKIIGAPMSGRATDRRLDRETRSSLVFSLIIECLHAFRESREPAVPYSRIQQMIRSLDDEVRAYGAEAVQRFVSGVAASIKEGQAPTSTEQLFRSTAVPFFQGVWPQESSLATPGVSKALADLPAIAQDAFSEAVDVIDRFLVPFDCWSMHDYGLYGEEAPNFSPINNHEKAASFLRLLDLTIGTSEGSVIPYDLADALDHVRKVAPNLSESQAFRRLATAARRR